MSTSKLPFFSFSGTFSAIHVEIFFDHCEQRGEIIASNCFFVFGLIRLFCNEFYHFIFRSKELNIRLKMVMT